MFVKAFFLALLLPLNTLGNTLYSSSVLLQSSGIDSEYEYVLSTANQTITTEGVYIFNKSHTYTTSSTGDAAFIVNGSNITIDLNGGILFCASGVTATVHGIKIAAGSTNITIKNGTISGFPGNGIYCPGTSSSPIKNLILKNVRIVSNKNGIVGTYVYNATFEEVHTNDNTQAASTYGMSFTNSESIILRNCESNRNRATSVNQAFGIYFDTCKNIESTNVISGNLTGDGTQSFNLTSVTGAHFKNCKALSNTATDSTSTNVCAGFFLTASQGATFQDCISSSHTAPREAMGFYLNSSKGNIFENCRALRCTISDSGHPHARFAGFYSKNGIGNSWISCKSHNHHAGNTNTTDGDGAIGFYISSESQARFYLCEAHANGAASNHKANAIGFYLDDTVGDSPTDCTYCEILECRATANCTSATSGITAYGFRDDSTDTTNTFINCFSSSNSDNASPRIVTNYYMDLPIGGTTNSSWPRTEASMDSLVDLANKPNYYNVSITS